MIKHLMCCLALLAGSLASHAHAQLASPDGHLRVTVRVTPAHTLAYAVARDGKPVLLPSALGLRLEGADLTQELVLAATSPITPVREQYTMAVGKRRTIDYRANEQVFTVRNRLGQAMDVVLRVSNDGVAFRYVVAEPSMLTKRFVAEASSFAFAPGATAWLQPMSVAGTGWSGVNPAYEELYQRAIPVGTASPSAAGWVFPALFRTSDTWVALTEAGMDGSFHASRLQAQSPGGVYTLGTPMAGEVFTGGALLASATGTLRTPWRVLAIGSLATVMESTLGTDLAAPAIAFDQGKVKPGHAAWSWALLKDDGTVFDVQKKFIDYAADMHWQYTLVDADWDRKIGTARMQELAAYAASKNVGLLVWYNSSGAWNTTVYTPKGALLTQAQRVQAFARLAQMGIKGVKIDFFAGDGQSMIAYYIAILNDAARAGLLVNFHGATLPRGWTRTYPNLMTAEAVRGLEFTTFTQVDQDAVVRHAATLPFTRNLFDPMDFTPMVFGAIPHIERATRNGFELAESVLFLSGIQHFAETPEGMATAPAYVKAFLQQLPSSWDEVRFIDGYPGRYIVLARRAGATWYVAGLNADDAARSMTLDLGFLKGRTGQLIGDGTGPRDFQQHPIDADQAQVTLEAHGGFVAVFK